MVYKWKPQLGTKLYFCADMLLSTRPGVFLPVKVPWTWNKFWLRNDLSWKWFFSGRSRIWITRFSWCTHRVELCTMFKWKMMLKLSQDMHVSSKALLCSRSGHKPYLPSGKPILPPPPSLGSFIWIELWTIFTLEISASCSGEKLCRFCPGPVKVL